MCFGKGWGVIPQWLSRLARRTYKQYCAEECEGREFDPPLGNSIFFFLYSTVIYSRFDFTAHAQEVHERCAINSIRAACHMHKYKVKWAVADTQDLWIKRRKVRFLCLFSTSPTGHPLSCQAKSFLLVPATTKVIAMCLVFSMGHAHTKTASAAFLNDLCTDKPTCLWSLASSPKFCG